MSTTLTPIEQAERELAHALQLTGAARARLDDARAQFKPADYQHKSAAPLTNTLTLTAHQLGIYQDALEWYARWCFGQIERLPGPLDWSRRRLDAGVQEVDEALWRVKRLLFPEHPRYGSYGIGWRMPGEPGATEQNAGQVAYEMYRQALVYTNRIHHAADPAWTGNVYDSPTLHYSDQALPQIAALDPEAEVQRFREFLAELNNKYNQPPSEGTSF